MKVQLSPTKDQQFECIQYCITGITSRRLVTSALVAWGYAPKNVAEYLDEEFARERLGIELEVREYMPRFEGNPDDCKFEEGEAEKITCQKINYD